MKRFRKFNKKRFGVWTSIKIRGNAMHEWESFELPTTVNVKENFWYDDTTTRSDTTRVLLIDALEKVFDEQTEG
jgi:hypothetical protein